MSCVNLLFVEGFTPLLATVIHRHRNLQIKPTSTHPRVTRDVIFVLRLDQISTKWTNLVLFKVRKLILKSPRFIPFGANLVKLEVKYDIYEHDHSTHSTDKYGKTAIHGRYQGSVFMQYTLISRNLSIIWTVNYVSRYVYKITFLHWRQKFAIKSRYTLKHHATSWDPEKAKRRLLKSIIVAYIEENSAQYDHLWNSVT